MGKQFDTCPFCGKKGRYIPRHWFGQKLGPGDTPYMCKFCHHHEIKRVDLKPVKFEDVHTRHCCKKHGCKYGKDETCSVVSMGHAQEGPCETCRMEPEIDEDNKPISRKELYEYLKQNLTIELDIDSDWYSSGLRVTIRLDGEVISSSTSSIPRER